MIANSGEPPLMKIKKSNNKYCIFTSAGNRNVIKSWVNTTSFRQFDLIVAYYDDDDITFQSLQNLSDLCFRIKGGKYQNIWNLWKSNKISLSSYDYVWIADDDMQISYADIVRAFSIADHFSFWVSSPSHDPSGKISNPFMIKKDGDHDIRLVTYIEVTWPIFRSDMLEKFLAVYDGTLTCWGVDHWWANVFQTERNFTSAIFDCISAINTPDEQKGGRREIGRLVTDHALIEAFEQAKKKYNFAGVRPRTVAKISLEWDVRFAILGQSSGSKNPIKKIRAARMQTGSSSIEAPGAAQATPRFSESEGRFLERHVATASSALFFGASWLLTTAVSGACGTIVAVETSESALRTALEDPHVSDATRSGRVEFIHVELGQLRANGQPATRTAMSRWSAFPDAPWPSWNEADSGPELVIVAGPFRKACCIRSLIHWHQAGRTPSIGIILHNLSGPNFDFVEDLSPYFEVRDRAGALVQLMPRRITPAQATHANFLLSRWQLDLR
ncbi:hypothetical protein AAFN86_23375 [Roseomonas sp. CAU 1739]|uniref:hypothetical protein n=1 Tax=Roseomonas sp. CAU 1739 TaxID=3140364 RepID=UPI00325A9740